MDAKHSLFQKLHGCVHERMPFVQTTTTAVDCLNLKPAQFIGRDIKHVWIFAVLTQ
jgi:hypothetical protein